MVTFSPQLLFQFSLLFVNGKLGPVRFAVKKSIKVPLRTFTPFIEKQWFWKKGLFEVYLFNLKGQFHACPIQNCCFPKLVHFYPTYIHLINAT